jgi:hypothetical protein
MRRSCRIKSFRSHEPAFFKIRARKKTGTKVTGLRFFSSRDGVELRAAARGRGWSTARWCNWGTAGDWRTTRFRSRTAMVIAVASEAIPEQSGKQATVRSGAWIRFAARLWCTADRCRCATWFWLRAAGFAIRRMRLETTKEASFCRLRCKETTQYSHGQHGKNTSH